MPPLLSEALFPAAAAAAGVAVLRRQRPPQVPAFQQPLPARSPFEARGRGRRGRGQRGGCNRRGISKRDVDSHSICILPQPASAGGSAADASLPTCSRLKGPPLCMAWWGRQDCSRTAPRDDSTHSCGAPLQGYESSWVCWRRPRRRDVGVVSVLTFCSSDCSGRQ